MSDNKTLAELIMDEVSKIPKGDQDVTTTVANLEQLFIAKVAHHRMVCGDCGRTKDAMVVVEGKELCMEDYQKRFGKPVEDKSKGPAM